MSKEETKYSEKLRRSKAAFLYHSCCLYTKASLRVLKGQHCFHTFTCLALVAVVICAHMPFCMSLMVSME